MAFTVTKLPRLFSSSLSLPKVSTFSFRTYSRASAPSFSLQCASPLNLRSVHLQSIETKRTYSGARDTDELDLYAPPFFILTPQSTLPKEERLLSEKGFKILRHLSVTFEAHRQTLGEKIPSTHAIKEALSRDFFIDEIAFSEHLIRFFQSLSPSNTMGIPLTQAVKAYANCRLNILSKHPSTRSFHYSNPFLTILPPEIISLRNLKTLDLRDSAIKLLPSVFLNRDKISFPSLLSLNLNQSRISSLGALLSHCPKLQSLSLRSHGLQSLPNIISSLHDLKFLDLHKNEFQHIPFALFSMSLTHLDLSHNGISELPHPFYSDAFDQDQTKNYKLFESLSYLDLSHNLIEGPVSYRAFSNLETLNLSYNELKTVHISRRNSALKSLNLSSNQLTTLKIDPPETGKIGVKELILNANPLLKIPSDLLEEIRNIYATPIKSKGPSPLEMVGC